MSNAKKLFKNSKPTSKKDLEESRKRLNEIGKKFAGQFALPPSLIEALEGLQSITAGGPKRLAGMASPADISSRIVADFASRPRVRLPTDFTNKAAARVRLIETEISKRSTEIAEDARLPVIQIEFGNKDIFFLSVRALG
jgi:hypothetical protein